jgi:hypothetical protein
MVFVAVGVGAAVSATGSIIGGSMAADATEEAAKKQVQAQQEALAQQEKLTAPYRSLGESAIPSYQALLGIGPQGQRLSPQQISQQLTQMPGYQFQLSQGLDATKRQAAAMGLGLSGNTLQALNKYGQGLASTSYQNQLENLLNPIKLGQASASNQAAAAGQTGANLSNIYGAAGQNQANIALGTVQGVTNAIGGATNNLVTMNTLQGLTDTGAMGAAYRPQVTDMRQYYDPQVFAR